MDIEKRYYTIGEVAEMFNVKTSLIRFWEGQFDHIKPRKNKNGTRQFTKEDLDDIRMVFELVKDKGYTLAGAKELIKKKTTVKDSRQIIESLTKVKDFLSDLKKHVKEHGVRPGLTEEQKSPLEQA